MRKCKSGCAAHSLGIAAISRSIPLRYINRLRTTTVSFPDSTREPSGSKCSATTAFGMTDTLLGSRFARSVVFSLPVCETHTTPSTSLSAKRSSLFVRIDAVSENPNRLWSVNTARSPIVRACKMPSCAIDDSA